MNAMEWLSKFYITGPLYCESASNQLIPAQEYKYSNVENVSKPWHHRDIYIGSVVTQSRHCRVRAKFFRNTVVRHDKKYLLISIEKENTQN